MPMRGHCNPPNGVPAFLYQNVDEVDLEELRASAPRNWAIVEFRGVAYEVRWLRPDWPPVISHYWGQGNKSRDALAARCLDRTFPLAKGPKDRPYFSVRRPYNVNLNCGGGHLPGSLVPISCVDLSLAWTSMTLRSWRGKPDYSRFSNIPSLLDNIPHNNAWHFTELIQQCRAWAIEAGALGDRFAKMFTEMEAAQQSLYGLLLSTVNHVLGVALKIKHRGGKPHYVVLLYEPNCSVAHRRVAADRIDDIARLTLASFLPHADIREYLPNGDCLLVHHVDKAILERVRRRASGAPAPSTAPLHGNLPPLSRALLALLLGHNQYAAAMSLVPIVRAMPEPARRALLVGSQQKDDAPLVFHAIDGRHPETLQAFAALIEMLDPADRKRQFTEVDEGDGDSARTPTEWALTAQNAVAAGPFLKVMARLIPDDAMSILESTVFDKHENPLCVAANEGSAGTLRAFFDAIAHLTSSEKARWMTRDSVKLFPFPVLQGAMTSTRRDPLDALSDALDGMTLKDKIRVLNQYEAFPIPWFCSRAAWQAYAAAVDRHIPLADRPPGLQRRYLHACSFREAPARPSLIGRSVQKALCALFGLEPPAPDAAASH